MAVAPAWAQVHIDKAWVRATVQGQKATGAFMQLTAPQNTQLVAVSSPAAGVSEIHEMTMEGGVMKMRAMPALDLPAKKTVELRPGGYHLMLMDLKTPLTQGSTVALTLTFKDAMGTQVQQQISLPVSKKAISGMQGSSSGHSGHKH